MNTNDFDLPNWQRLRSDFNHQWMKNRLLSALDSLANLLNGKIRAAGYLEDVLSTEVSEWSERGRDLEVLLHDFESEMSPRKLMATPPLCELEADIKAVIAECIHQLWLVRYPVGEWLETARSAYALANQEYERLLKIKTVQFEGRINPEFAVCFDAFRIACRDLSTAIGKFPNQILVI